MAIKTINTIRWAHQEFTTPLDNSRLHNSMYLASVKGRLLGVNLSVAIEQHAAHIAELRAMFESIRFTP